MHDLDATCKDFVMGTLLISLIVTIITSIFSKLLDFHHQCYLDLFVVLQISFHILVLG